MVKENREAVAGYVERGWYVLPLQAPARKPWPGFDHRRPTKGDSAKQPRRGSQGYKDARNDLDGVNWDTYRGNVGIATGASGLVVIDVDNWYKWRELGVELPETYSVATPSRDAAGKRGQHFYFTGTGYHSRRFYAGDIRGDTGYVVAPPSHLSMVKERYEVVCDVEPVPMTEELWNAITALEDPFNEGGTTIWTNRELPDEVKDGEGRHDAMVSYCGRLRAAGVGPGERFYDQAMRFNKKTLNPPLDESEALRIAKTFDDVRKYPVPLTPQFETIVSQGLTDLARIHVPPFPKDDYGNGLRAQNYIRGRARWSPERERWLVWSDRDRWEWQERGMDSSQVHRWIVASLNDVAAIEQERAQLTTPSEFAEFDKHIASSRKISQINATIRQLARAPGMSIELDELDQDENVLGTQNGAVELSTGNLLKPDPRRFITRMASVDYKPEARCPAWEAEMERAFPDVVLRNYFQRLCGYMLYGHGLEQVMVFLYGPPRSGKSNLIRVLTRVLGDEFVEEPLPSTIFTPNIGLSTSALAKLRSSRVVVMDELGRNLKMNGELAKRITGGGRVTAAAKYENEVTFRPQFTMVITTNHLPAVDAEDDALWRRILVVPYDQTFTVNEERVDYESLFHNELDGILAWLVRGAVEWKSKGLKRDIPPQITEATEKWRSDNNTVMRFLEDDVEIDDEHSEPQANVRRYYTAWCQAQGVARLSNQAFLDAMRQRFPEGRDKGKPTWKGIRLPSMFD